MRINGLVLTALIAAGVYYGMEKLKGRGVMRTGA